MDGPPVGFTEELEALREHEALAALSAEGIDLRWAVENAPEMEPEYTSARIDCLMRDLLNARDSMHWCQETSEDLALLADEGLAHDGPLDEWFTNHLTQAESTARRMLAECEQARRDATPEQLASRPWRFAVRERENAAHTILHEDIPAAMSQWNRGEVWGHEGALDRLDGIRCSLQEFAEFDWKGAEDRLALVVEFRRRNRRTGSFLPPAEVVAPVVSRPSHARCAHNRERSFRRTSPKTTASGGSSDDGPAPPRGVEPRRTESVAGDAAKKGGGAR
jgi:hypothetical protein